MPKRANDAASEFGTPQALQFIDASIERGARKRKVQGKVAA